MQLSFLLVVSCLLFLETRCLPQYWTAHHQLPSRLMFLPRLAPYLLPPTPLSLWPGLGRVGVQTPPDDILTSSGLRIELLRTSVFCARRVKAGDRLTVDYTGNLASTGEQFDSSDGEEPITFVIGEGRLIQGWEEGLIDRCEGDQLRLIIPPHLGYGEEGKRKAGDGGEEEPTEEFVIPPDSTLIFTLDLVKVQAPIQ